MTGPAGFLLTGALVWLVMPIGAIANGAVRDLLLAPLLGVRAAGIVSVLVLLAFIYAVTALFLARVNGNRRPVALWGLGLLWMGLTVTFEFVFFGLVMGVPLPELLAAYDILSGELWLVVVLGVLLAPPAVGAALRRRRGWL